MHKKTEKIARNLWSNTNLSLPPLLQYTEGPGYDVKWKKKTSSTEQNKKEKCRNIIISISVV
uniref:Uncharacterized protein LOC105640540 isoform X2 n=1 Tax=Rhizophora mucronata TaxID=61149 RepID=A0A2P2L6K2_RHIMU